MCARAWIISSAVKHKQEELGSGSGILGIPIQSPCRRVFGGEGLKRVAGVFMGFTCALMGNALGLITGDYGVWWREGGNRGRQQMREGREEQRLDAELHSRYSPQLHLIVSTSISTILTAKRFLTPNFTYIKNECVERVHTFWFLCVLIFNDISWTENIVAIIKKAQQRLHFLRVLRKHNLDSGLLLTFYRTSIKSQLAYCISVWYSSCTMADKEMLQRVARTAQKIIGRPKQSQEQYQGQLPP
ncbi:hypothetical protein ACEWY4_007079 [Coilia grayii]|uniref:Alkylated DNA repair protein AlkB homologue 8 N-terminal domain-containing protein n=1 Tax=Coilia grayii TaxID=363190 RepID=A0ABD1KFG4_9TELE